MNWKDFVRSFFRQCAYALAVFSGLAMLGEFLTPGAVTPFIDPLPLALLALAFLCMDAVQRRAEVHMWWRLPAAVCVAIVLTLLFMADKTFAGKAEQMVLIVFLGAVCSVVGSLVFAPPPIPSS